MQNYQNQTKTEKLCQQCKTVKPISEFGIDRHAKDGHVCYCRDCKRERNRVFRESHQDYIQQYRLDYKKPETRRERERQYARDYRKRHPNVSKITSARYRARIQANGGRITRREQLECLLFFDFRCAYTGVRLGDDFTWDHVVPISKGGQNVQHNIVPCVKSANLSKAARDFEEWYSRQDYYLDARLNRIRRWIAM